MTKPKHAPQAEVPIEGDEPLAVPQAETAAPASEAAEWKDRALRAAAELENFRKRAAQEAESARLYASQSFARDMLTVADNLSRAIAAAEGNEGNKALLDGIRMVAANLEQTLKRHGIARIAVKPGDTLNPDLHQVMAEVASDAAPGTIAQEMQPGYTLHGRLLRPAFVSIASTGGR